jgi:hypothetical protein
MGCLSGLLDVGLVRADAVPVICADGTVDAALVKADGAHLAALVLANLIAAVPARAAARIQSAAVLKTE